MCDTSAQIESSGKAILRLAAQVRQWNRHGSLRCGKATGSAVLELGGPKGRLLTIKQGDVVVLPAGTGHRLIKASRGFQVVGAYPAAGKYDECTDSRDRLDAVKRIARVQKPGSDPLYGKQGPLTGLWLANCFWNI
jgi:uncharacterized protein YjlB